MRITRLWLDGYGRFSGREIELAPGLQIIVGPNEQGKSTIRGFVGDMLYGQKASATQRRYDDSHELRRPWLDPETYSGRMLYVLDGGRAIEVCRVFDKKRESVQVIDRTHGEDITNQFIQLGNREPAFAEQHLGLTKAVFLNAATIGHLTLENLGDADALAQIREHILALTDSAEEGRSAEAALKYLETRIATIGRPSAQSKRPLPASRARLAELDGEYARAIQLRNDLAALERRRIEIQDELRLLEERQALLSEEERVVEKNERAVRFREAKQIEQEVREVTQQCFELSAVREFPLENGPEVQRAANALATARVQLDRTHREQADLQRQIEEERARVGDVPDAPAKDIPDEWDERLANKENDIRQMRDRFDSVEAERAAAAGRLSKAESEMATLPDFAGVPASPVEWLSQTAASFRVAQESRERERRALGRVQVQVTRCERDIAGQEHVFQPFEDFPRAAREYEVETRLFQEQGGDLRTRVEEAQSVVGEFAEDISTFRTLTIVSAAVIAIVVAVFVYRDMPGSYVPAIGGGLTLLLFLGKWLQARSSLKRNAAQARVAQTKLDELAERQRERQQTMDAVIARSGCSTLRELEALHDQYCANVAEFYQLRIDLDAQAARASAEEERVMTLFAGLRETFRKLNVELNREEDVQDAAAQAIALYQEYRDAKRRVMEGREQFTQLSARHEELKSRLTAAEKEERDLSLEVRRLMRDAGYLEERLHTSARKALQSFRIRVAQMKQKRGRLEVLQENAKRLAQRIEAEQRDIEKCEAGLGRYLRAVGADSMETWLRLAEKARTYREIWARRTSLQQQLDILLQGENLETLQNRVDADGPCAVSSKTRTVDALRAEKNEIADRLRALSEEEHGLHLEIAERAAGVRSLNEIEEERASARERLAQLELEMEAAVHAAALIEEVARDKHARIAPRLAKLAGGYLGEITGGVYGELLVNRDIEITIRIPQTQQLSSDPERVLSTGTVDQIYLALRLALVECLCEVGESVPMLLDDPFANYDNERLMNALRLVHRLSEKTQFILFTCREDVAEAARATGAPILNL